MVSEGLHLQTRRAFNAASSAASCADPTCSRSSEPPRAEYTICTAVAPDAVCTVRTDATNEQRTGSISAAIRPDCPTNPQLRALSATSGPNVSQVRYYEKLLEKI